MNHVKKWARLYKFQHSPLSSLLLLVLKGKPRHIKTLKSLSEQTSNQTEQRQIESVKSAPAGAEEEVFIEDPLKQSKEMIWLAIAHSVTYLGEPMGLFVIGCPSVSLSSIRVPGVWLEFWFSAH